MGGSAVLMGRLDMSLSVKGLVLGAVYMMGALENRLQTGLCGCCSAVLVGMLGGDKGWP